MATDAAAPRLRRAGGTRNRLGWRTGIPGALAVLVVGSALGHAWLGRRVPSPWYADEFVYGTSARAIAADWQLLYERFAAGFYLYPRLIAPAWIAESPGHAYGLAKAANAGLMALAGIPVYFWARRLVGGALALVAVALVLVLPTGVYSAMLVTENAFFPAFLFALYAIALALERPRVLTQLLVLFSIGLACAIRLQGLVLVLVLLTAIAVKGALDARHDGRGWRAAARRQVRAYGLVLGILAAGAAAYAARQFVSGGGLTGGLGVYAGAVTADYSFGNVLRWLVYHVAGLALSTGVLPFSVLLLLVADVVRRVETATAAERAFVAVAVSAPFWLVLQVGVFASRRAERIDERYLFHVVPLFLIALVLWLVRGAYRPPRAVFVAAMAPALLLVALPVLRLIDDPGHSSDTFTLVALERFRSHLAAPTDIRLVLALVVAAAAGAVAFAPRRLLFAVAPLALFGWFAYASVAVAHSLQASSRGVLDGTRLGTDRGWVDAAVGRDADVSILNTATGGATEGIPLTLLETYFWNRSVKRVAAADAPQVCCIPRRTATLDPATGVIGPAFPSRHVLAIPDVALDGRAVARRPSGVLYRFDGPLRLGSLTTGVYADGWMASRAVYQQFAAVPPSLKRVAVTIARTAWTGPSPASSVRVQLIARGRPVAAETTTLGSQQSRSLSFPVPRAPFRIDVDVSPTFAPSAYGGTDTRQLGAQVSFSLERQLPK